METREARIADAGQIAELLGQLGYPADEDSVRRRLERLGRSEADATWVAEADGELVGLVGIHVSQVLAYDGDAAKVSEIVVDDRYRRRGIGARLMQVAEEEARRRGCVVLFLTTAERRKDAHAFYRRLGLEETGRRFAKSLDQP
jgi:N-acetylglutamate synthase-like GNAT family acetyltransferase